MAVLNVTYALPAGTVTASGGIGAAPPPVVVATAFSMTGSANGTTNVASTITVTPVGGPLANAATVTLAITGGGTLSTTTLSFASGATAGQSVTITRTADGTSTVTMTNTLGLTNPAPFAFTSGAPVTAGAWQRLSVAPHLRKVIRTSTPANTYDTYSTLTPGAQAAVEALTPETVQGVPSRGYNVSIRGKRRQRFMAGSLHSGYPGNELDMMSMPFGGSTQIVTTINHQPVAPPTGPGSGYGGYSSYIYKVTYAPEGVVGLQTQAEAVNWQPFHAHNWTMASWTPYMGYVEILAHPIQTGQAAGQPYHTGTFSIINNVLQCSGKNPSDTWASGINRYGLVGYDEADGRYKTWISQIGSEITTLPSSGYPFSDGSYGLGTSGLGDWNNYDQSLLLFNSISNSMNILRWHPVRGVSVLASMLGTGKNIAIGGLGGGDGHSNNGWLVRNLEARKYLMLTQTLQGYAGIKLFLYSEDFIYHQWTGSISGTVMTVSSIANDKSVMVGARISGTGITAGTTVVNQLTGRRGREGTYTVSTSQTVASTTIALHPDERCKPLTPPASAFTGCSSVSDPLTYCVDRNSRRVFWLVAPTSAPIRLYVSNFDDLMAWTPITMSNPPTWPRPDDWFVLDRQPMIFEDGYLHINNNGTPPAGANPGWLQGAMDLLRIKVDGGEELPSMDFARYDHRLQARAPSSTWWMNIGGGQTEQPGLLQMHATKHVNWAYRPSTDTYHQMAGDFGSSTCQSMCTLKFDGTARGYTFTQILDEVTNPPAGKVRPAAPDDGHWFYVPTDSVWVEARDKFVFCRGGDGEPMFYNQFLGKKYNTQTSGFDPTYGNIAQTQAAIADGWDLSSKFYLFDPADSTFTTLGASYVFNANGNPGNAFAANGSYQVSAYNGWTQDNGGAVWPDVWAAASNTSRNGCFDPTTGTVWRFFSFSSTQALACFNFLTKTVKVYNVNDWVSPDTGRQIFLAGPTPTSESAIISDGPRPKFCWQNPGNGRYFSPSSFEWEHKATWLNPADGKLYVVSPTTGYLWCFETRGAQTINNGNRIPFYPLGNRIPLVGTFCVVNSRDRYPPWVFDIAEPNPKTAGTNGDVRMNSFIVPFKGGLLWWSSGHHDSGVTGHPRYAFWRSLSSTGDWTVVSFPQELSANSFGVRSPYSASNAEVMLISTAGNADATQADLPWPFFWRLT